MRDLSLEELRPVLGSSILNLIRRGADGTLRMSADRWRLASIENHVVIFRSLVDDQQAGPEQVLQVTLEDVERITWDRLPRQQTRSQLRFHLTNGDLWTFSGALMEPSAS